MAWVLLSVFFPLQAKAELSSAAGGIVIGGGMSTGVAGVSAGIPSASPGLQAPSIDGVPLQPLLTNTDSATAASQDNVNPVEQTGGTEQDPEQRVSDLSCTVGWAGIAHVRLQFIQSVTQHLCTGQQHSCPAGLLDWPR